MSTYTRRQKVVEARKALKATVKSAVPEPLFSDDEPETKSARNGNGAKKKAEATVKVREARPIYADLTRVSDYVFTDHALEQMHARNVSPAEVYSAIANPDTIVIGEREEEKDVKQLDRGDIRVVVNSDSRSIVTVIDLDEDARTEPRVPQTANLIVPAHIPAVLPDVAKPGSRIPKELPESDEMRWLFGRHTRKDARFIDISPVVAKALLDRNVRNRKQRGSDVDDWAAEMAAGRWRETGETISIARDGILLNGQHRLQAVVDSGVTINILVVVGLDPEVFAVIDTGRRRSAADALGMVGATNLTQLAAITRLCYEFDMLVTTGSRVPHNRRLHHDVLLGYRAGKEEPLQEATNFAQIVRAFGLPINKTGAGAAFFFIHRDGNDLDLASDFFEGVRTGISLVGTDPRYVLRRVVTNDADKRLRSLAYRHLALTLKAWNLYARGDGCRTLAWRVDEEMPVVYRSRTNL